MSETLTSPIDYADPIVASAMQNGRMNTPDDQVLANIRHAIRLGHPQMRPGPVQPDRICLVGGGPSLAASFTELRDLVWGGARLVTVNGAYQYCLDRGLKPNTQIVLDARASNARFVEPAVPGCRYVLASQCDPQVWNAVDGREQVWIFHAAVRSESAITAILDDFYDKRWSEVPGGVTVATRALMLLRIAGYVRFDLFGVDSCWQGQSHHAFEQPENARDQWFTITAGGSDPSQQRAFRVSPWMLKQAEDFLSVIKAYGSSFLLSVHGDGLLAHLLTVLADDDEPVISPPVDEG
jgi:hypothetical protein